MNNNALQLEGMAPLLQVFDMPRSLDFYCNRLGFKLIQQAPEGVSPDWVLLERDGISLMLNTAYERPHRPEYPDAARSKWHQDTTLYFGCPKIDEAYAALTAKGISLPPPITTGYGWKALSFTDPDGYQLVFHWPLG